MAGGQSPGTAQDSAGSAISASASTRSSRGACPRYRRSKWRPLPDGLRRKQEQRAHLVAQVDLQRLAVLLGPQRIADRRAFSLARLDDDPVESAGLRERERGMAGVEVLAQPPRCVGATGQQQLGLEAVLRE